MSQTSYKTVEGQLSDWIRGGILDLWPDQDLSGIPLSVTPTADSKFGDFQCNAAMPMAKQLQCSPRQIAERVAAEISPHPSIARMEVAGPGFINLYLDEAWLSGFVLGLESHPTLGTPKTGEGQTVILDYSSPNVAKPMHVAHIRSTVIGNAYDRMLRFLGNRVISDNHLGDWGTQFGIVILGYRNFLDEEAYARDPVEELARIYVKSNDLSKDDPDWRESAKQELVKLQQGDEENLKLWKEFVRLSIEEYDRMYERLGVQFDLCRGESYYNQHMPRIVELLEEKNLLEESDGAKVVHVDGEKVPCIVQKSDGGFNYAASDLATVQSRMEEFNPDRMVYFTDETQQLHFRQVFGVVQRLGWKADLKHVWFGLMRLPEGRFSTRAGNVIQLKALLDEAESRALAMIQTSSPDMPEEQQQEVAAMVGIGAVKYADLSQNPQSPVTFTWDKAMALDGNSAPYLQYAHARICSVLDKYAAAHPEKDLMVYPIELHEPLERDLALRVTRFGEAVLGAAEQYRPNILCDYLYQLAQAYSSFYQNLPFLKAEEGVRESRLRLCGITAKVLRQGLDLLGIQAPERI